MSSQKQILIFENPGLSKASVAGTFRDAGFSHALIWEEGETNPGEVEYIITVKKPLNATVLMKYPNVKMIAVAFTGFDSVDLNYCRKNNIAVYNVPAYSTNAVVELAIGLTISVLRDIPLAYNTIHSNGWDLKPGLELNGKTVGIVGTGKIGRTAARVFKAFGCDVIGWSRSHNEEFIELGGEYVTDIKQLFSSADIVSIHLPLNEHTKGMIGSKELGAMKGTAYLINTARGPIVDEKELIRVLDDKKIAGAGLDVFEQEPLPPDSPLLGLDNVVLTPHIAYKTEEAIQRRVQVTVENLKRFMDKDGVNRVDGPIS